MVTLMIRAELYSEETIAEGIRAYKGYATISCSQNDEYWHLCFKDCKYEEGRTIKEFENYIIGIENK